MSKQRTLIALDWLMPVLQDVFDELNRLLQHDEKPMPWAEIGQALHQITGALKLSNQALLAKFSDILEQVVLGLEQQSLTGLELFELKQAVLLLQHEITQLQSKQQLHDTWLVDRINYFGAMVGEPPYVLATATDHSANQGVDGAITPTLPLLPNIPIPLVTQPSAVAYLSKLLILWRYSTLELLKQDQNNPDMLAHLAKVAKYLASSPLNSAMRQIWHLVSLWLDSLARNEKPTPSQYVMLLEHLERLLMDDTYDEPDLATGRLAMDILLNLSQLTHQTDDTKNLLNDLDFIKNANDDTLFSQLLAKLERAIYQIQQPAVILPVLESIKATLASRGWAFYQQQLEQVIADTQFMLADDMMASSLAWQVERQLQDLYSQLLETLSTLESQIGIAHFAYAVNPEQEAVRTTRVHLENIKLAYNNYSQSHDHQALQVNDDMVAIIQVFGLLGLTRPQELMEQLRLLFNRIHKNKIDVLSWEANDLIAEMIAQLELFLDYLSHQSVSDELLDVTQSQLNRANLLLKRLIDTPLDKTQLPSRHKTFPAKTVVYDDNGEVVLESVAESQAVTESPEATENTDEITAVDVVDVAGMDDIEAKADVEANRDVIATDADTPHTLTPKPAILSEAYLTARQLLKPDDYSMDDEIREIFIEEAEEVLGEMDDNLPTWQQDPQDLASLKEIRRNFHTLKGSGRMVGAFQVGEMAWAVENMLNRVLDGTLPITDEVVGFISETRQNIPTLVEDFANQREPRLDPAVTILKANNLLQGQPINTGLPTVETVENRIDNVRDAKTSDAEISVAEANMTESSNKVDEKKADADDVNKADSTELATASQATSIAKTSLPMGQSIVLPAVVQQQYDELTEVTDSVIDPDIQEIYIEEAQEVLETITPLFDTWQANPSDTDTLKEIRRGFHTLKGSGRMVGANQLGELAWSIESMLNRVLDNTITANEGVVALVGDVIHAFGGLVDIFAQNRTDYPDTLKIWSAIANSYTKKHGDSFDYHAIMGASATTQAQASSASANPLDNVPSVQASSDDSLDTDNEEINEVFWEESQELIAKINTFIESHNDEDTVNISDELVRSFHTLRGGAGLSELPRIYKLSGAVEESLAELLRKEVPLTQEQMAVLQEATQDLQQYLVDYQSQHSVRPQHDDDEHIHDITQQLMSNAERYASNTHATVQSLLELGIDDLLDADQYFADKFAQQNDEVAEYATLLESQAEKLANASVGVSYLVIPETLQIVYNKLIHYPQFVKDPQVVEQLTALHQQLINMFDAIAAGLSVVVDVDGISKIKQLLADKQYHAEMDAIEYEAIYTDIELLEIFLDETQSVRPEMQKYFNQWQNNLTNLEGVSELRRHYHTLKGGASMVGINSIASIAQRGEYLYDRIATARIPSDTDIALVMQKTHETLLAQLQQVTQNQRSFFAHDLIAQLDAILAGKVVARDIIPAVPLIVETSQEELANTNTEASGGDDSVTPVSDAMYVQEIINNFEERRLDTWHGHEPDEDILAVFLEEAKELVDSSSQNLQAFRNNNSDVSALQALQRELHTIKGGARMVGAEGLANLAHEMETIYEELGSRRKPATRMIGNLLATCHDWLASSLYVLENKYNPQTPTPLIRALQDFSHNPDSLKEIPTASLANQIEQIDIYKSSLNEESVDKKVRDLTQIPSMRGNFEHEQDQGNANAEMLRISAGLMERMINLSGESAINRARIEMGMTSLTHNLEEMGGTTQRLVDQLRRMETELEIQILAQIGDEIDTEFDPLEMDQYSALNQLSKSLSESASDLVDIKTTMLDTTRDTENLLLQLSRTQAELQDGLMNSQTVPFSRITPRLQRIARQTATELGKSVELRILNDDGELDRNILERITSPLEHMLRNAVDHGVEKTQERIEAGKSRTGLITLEVVREGGEIVIHLTDDGKGINVEAVRKKAIEQGLISANDTSLKPVDIMQFIFNAGLSTAKAVSQISGRGVGMDVVQSEVKQLGGVVLVDSEAGKGSRFTMRLPLTVAVSDALLVKAGDKHFAVPLVQIERVVRINAETIYQFHSLQATTLDIDGEEYRLRYLNQILFGSDPLEAVRQHAVSVPIIIIRTETGQRMALQVDALEGSRTEVVVKPLGRQLSHVAGISSATIMGDGSVMLILDLIALMRNASVIQRSEHKKATPVRKSTRKPIVLIIDDSVTVRKVTSRLLERNGYETQIATDGVDALEKLQQLTPDIMLLDIEMPRMDGFEVANQVRHNPRLKDVPIIMITSRTGEKHRERALAIGVNQYLGKPFQEKILLDTMAELLPDSHPTNEAQS
ncbi:MULTISPECIES: Hpt domain-containing protein [unclassified Moraxella]|uniref:Hpt domain-containing protein n=1 Tax=unclassified Moraxella TaxID=2685852 RepID=UPI003AF8D207